MTAFRQSVEAMIPALRRYATRAGRRCRYRPTSGGRTRWCGRCVPERFSRGDCGAWLLHILTNLNKTGGARWRGGRNSCRCSTNNPDASGTEAEGRDSPARWRTLVEEHALGAAFGDAEGLSYREVADISGCADRNRDVAPRPAPAPIEGLARGRTRSASAGENDGEHYACGCDETETRRLTDPRISRLRSELHAYVDKRIPAERRGDVEALGLAAIPTDAARVQSWRAMADALHARYDSVADEAVPKRLEIERLVRQPRKSGVWRHRRDLWRSSPRWGRLAGAWRYRVALGVFQALTVDALDAHRLYVVEVRHPVEVPGSDARICSNG